VRYPLASGIISSPGNQVSNHHHQDNNLLQATHKECRASDLEINGSPNHSNTIHPPGTEDIVQKKRSVLQVAHAVAYRLHASLLPGMHALVGH